jgi:phosphatidylcholine synthase
MMAATIIDATDGTFARLVRIKDVLPMFDGRRLDDLVDFLNYSFLPLLLLWRANIPSAVWAWTLVIPLLASAYGFCQVAIKTTDGYFLGFPSCWNVVAFYLYMLAMPDPASVAILVALSFLTFLPTRYLYPSQPGWINKVTIALAVIWCCMIGYVLVQASGEETPSASTGRFSIAVASLFFPAYYMVVSWYISLRGLLGRSP